MLQLVTLDGENRVGIMKPRTITNACAALLVALSTVGVPALAQKTATPTSVKIGYFNLALVKASYPQAAGSETLRTNAENQLRRDVEAGNKRLQKAQEDGKPKEEIEKMAQELQVQINAKQQALIQLVQTQQAIATQNIAQAVNQVARDKELDLVVDGASVFAGGEKVVNNGVDITDEIVKKLTATTGIKRPASSDKSGGGGTSSGGGESGG